MTFTQIVGILRIVLPAVLAFAVGKGWITQDMSVQILSILTAIVGSSVYSAYSNTQLNLAKTVAAVPGVQVQVSAVAPPELQTAAHDRSDASVRDIVPASLDPAPYPPNQRK